MGHILVASFFRVILLFALYLHAIRHVCTLCATPTHYIKKQNRTKQSDSTWTSYPGLAINLIYGIELDYIRF